MGDLLERIIKRMGVEVDVSVQQARVRPEQSEVMMLICNNNKAQTRLGWTPIWSLDEGIDAVVDYVKSNLEVYKTLKYEV